MSLATRAYIGLGSNLNNPKVQLKRALNALEKKRYIKISAFSKYYISKPLRDISQPNYYNAVVAIDTTLSATDLLKICQKIEDAAGRVRRKKWEARIIDLDILIFGNKIIRTEELIIPHTEIAKRTFVLIPLFDVAPNLYIPSVGKLSVLIKKTHQKILCANGCL